MSSLVPQLRHFEVNETKDKSASDSSQVPLASASAYVYKRGATVNDSGGGSFADGVGGTINVHHPGDLAAGDVLFVDADRTGNSRTVTSVTTTTVVVSAGSGLFSWNDYSRLVPSNNQPTLYQDPAGTGSALSNPLTLNARGKAEFWTSPGAVDILISDADITDKLNQDQQNDFESRVIRADLEPGADMGEKIASALGKLDSTYGGIVDAQALDGAQSWAADPFSGITTPFLLLLGSCLIDVDVEIVGLQSDDQYIRGFNTIIRAHSSNFPTSSDLFAVGDGSNVLGDCGMSGVQLDANSVSGVTGLLIIKAQDGTSLEDIRIANADNYGVHFNDASTRNVRLRRFAVETINAGSSAVYVDSTVGEGCSLHDAYLESASGTQGTAGINKNNAEAFTVGNIQFATGGFSKDVLVAADGMVGYGLTSGANSTTLVHIATGVTEYAFMGVEPNGATNSFVDTDLSITNTTFMDQVCQGNAFIRNLNPAGDSSAEGVVDVVRDGSLVGRLRKDGRLEASGLKLIHGPGPAASATPDAGWGVGAAAGTIQGTDEAGFVVISAAGTPAANAAVAVVFSTSRTSGSYIPLFAGPDLNHASAAPWILEDLSTSGFTARYDGTPVAGQSYRLGWVLVDPV